ncbi:uncharacterized protein PAC_11318 [Phialocephala subalpina]|uniref:Uncharacterized protein n=1 Tax=Phialocephala subalpina TaxID=576137 RepID=A0A1L7X8T5_9HELO|nr:uncharacterized protein PAC_11318 [Phialocephala subalpina]
MGSCMTRLEREMVNPPPNSGNWESLSPQRPEAYVPRQRHQMEKVPSGAPLGRRETPSGVPGLTYDHAGRPVCVSSPNLRFCF